MTTVEMRTKISFIELLGTLKQLGIDELSEIASTAVRLRANSRQQVLSKHEATLLQQINSALTPAEQARMDMLIERRQAEMVTQAELAELIALSDRVEEIQVERLSALIELAAIRDIPLDDVRELQHSLAPQ